MSEEVVVDDSSESESNDFEEHVICGVSVAFPFVPYPCQLDYMEKVIQALQKVVKDLYDTEGEIINIASLII